MPFGVPCPQVSLVRGKARSVRSPRPVVLLLALLALTLGLRTAEAKGGPIPVSRHAELTDSIINAKTPGERKGPLKELLDSPRGTHAETYGAVLGPVFRNAARSAGLDPDARREMYAALIAHLADDQPEDSPVLLVKDFLPHLAEDPKLVEVLRTEKLATIRGRQEGWERILRVVRTLLNDEDKLVRRSAVRISAECDCSQEADTLAALYEAVKQAGTNATPEDEAAYLATAQRLLQYRFADLSALLKFLSGHAARFEQLKAEGVTDTLRYKIRGEVLADVIGLYRAMGGAGIRKARAAALAYGRTVVEKAAGPADLLLFFDPERERFPELQRAAVAAAAPPRMKPVPDAAWANLLRQALDHSDDSQVLERVIALIGETFTTQTNDTQLLAGALARRIRDGAAKDTLAHRRTLASILGSIGLQGDVRAALPRRLGLGDAGQRDVYYVLIRAFGIVKNGLVIQLVPYYLAVGQNRQPQWARLAVAEALGLQGFRNNPEQKQQAAMMLHHILTGEAVRVVELPGDQDKPVIAGFVGDAIAKIPEDAKTLLDVEAAAKEDDVAVITAAIESLEFYPSENAARVLGELAADDSEISATALKILSRQLGRGGIDAARVLAKLLESPAPEKRVLAVLGAISQTNAPQDPAVRAVLTEAVRGYLTSAASLTVRKEAALASVHLADVQAVKGIYLTWNGLAKDDEGRAFWKEQLGSLVAAVAKLARVGGDRGRRLDIQLSAELRAIATEGHRAMALAMLNAVAADADRFELKRLRADLRFEYADVAEGRTRAERRKDLEEAERLYRELVQPAPQAIRHDLRSSIYLVLVKRAQPEWLAEGETPQVLLLEALKAAADSGSSQLAKDALDKIADGLAKDAGSLTAAQRGELEQTTKRLRVLAEKANGK